MIYAIFIISNIISFAMGWHLGYGHGRQVGLMIAQWRAKRRAKGLTKT